MAIIGWDRIGAADMPGFRDPDGSVWHWDPSSKSYVKGEQEEETNPRRQTGGDNELFDATRHTELAQNPLREGILASSEAGIEEMLKDRTAGRWTEEVHAPEGRVVCPNCREDTDLPQCPRCGKGLQPEWNREEREGDVTGFEGQQERHEDGMPDRAPKRNRMKTDDSYPSMLSKVANDWGLDALDMERAERGKWIADVSGQLHITQDPAEFHEQLAERSGLRWPVDLGALGSVYDDGTADVQRVFEGFRPDLQDIQADLRQIFGQVELQGAAGEGEKKGAQFEPFQLRGGSWIVNRPVSGAAWVKERPEGVQYDRSMVLVAEHLQPEDFWLYGEGVLAIVTATGGSGSHAGLLARQHGWPVVAGLGAQGYSKIETGNHLNIDPTERTITVMPDRESLWNSILQQRQDVERRQPYRGMPANDPRRWWGPQRMELDMAPGQTVVPQGFFAHVDEERAFRVANPVSLDECPECSAPMVEKYDDAADRLTKFCPDCGHRQPVVYATVRKQSVAIGALALPLLGRLGLMGAGAAAGEGAGAGMMGGLVGGGAGGAAAGGGMAGFMPGVGRLMSGAMGGGMPGQITNQGMGAATAPASQGMPPDVAPGAGMAGMYSSVDHHFLYAADAPERPSPEARRAAFGEEEVGIATKNRGENSDPEHDGSGASFKEKGDSPELLKDVDGAGNAKGDPTPYDDPSSWTPEQQTAVQALEANLDLIEEFYNSDEAGSEHPIVMAVDEMLEAAFPGYKELAAGGGGEPELEAMEEIAGEDLDGDDEDGESGEHAEAVEDDDFEKAANFNEMHLVIDAAGNVVGQSVSENPDGTWKILTRQGYQDVSPQQVRLEKAAAEEAREMYHVTLAANELSIASGGLFYDPARQRNWEAGGVSLIKDEDARPVEQRPGVYLFASLGRAEDYAWELADWEEEEVLIYPVDTAGLDLERDPASVTIGESWISLAPIPPDRLGSPLRVEPRGSDYYASAARGWGLAAPHEGLEKAANTYTAPDVPPAGGVATCQVCGQNHMPGTPCPIQQPQAQPMVGMQPMQMPGVQPKVVTKTAVEGDVHDYAPSWEANAPACPMCGGFGTYLGSLGRREHYRCQNCGMDFSRVAEADEPYGTDRLFGDESSDWTSPPRAARVAKLADTDGNPLREGEDYELRAAGYAVPDHVTIDKVLPNKVVFTIQSGDMRYRDQLTDQEIETGGYEFASKVTPPTSKDHGPLDPDPYVPPVRPGHDAIPQVTDLSSPPTKVSAERDESYEIAEELIDAGEVTAGVVHDSSSREWLLEGTDGGVDVDPALMAKLAGKDFTPREQREFIDESGEARNLSKLDLEGTHYVLDDTDDEFAFGW
jgi:phosphohistidine swiveling domain-containing protein